MSLNSTRKSTKIPRILALTYLAFSTIWIVGTDLFVGISFRDEFIHIGKGMLFVSVTALLLYAAAKYHINTATKTEKTLTHIFEQSQIGIVLMNLEGQLVDCNDAFSRFLCCPKNELINTSIRDWIAPEQLDEANRLFELLVEKRIAYKSERKYHRRDGQDVWGTASASLIEGTGKDRGFVVMMVEDVTTSKHSHDALARSESRLRRLVQSDIIGVLFWDLDGRMKNANKAFLDIVGYSEEEIGKLKWRDITPPEYQQLDEDAVRQLRDNGVFRTYEKEFIRKNGSRIPVMLGGALFERGGSEGVAFVLDLSNLRKAQQEIIRLARIVESADDPVISLSLEGDILTWNRGAERLYGYKALEIIGKSFSTLFPSDHAQEAASVLDIVKRGRTLDHFETSLLTRSGESKPVAVTVSPMRDASGNLIGSSTMARDLTAQKHAQEMERQFRQAQKLESLGRLAGGIAHDFNNILTVIGSYAQLAECELPPNHPVCDHTQQILKATDRAAGLTRQMLAFSRKQLLAPKIIDLNNVIRETVDMVRRLIGEPIRVSFRAADHLWPINADPDQMTQVLLNLCVNARDAMPDGGRLSIETKNIEITSGSKRTNLGPGHYVLLSVADTGTGMSRELQEKIFEPFFTTKDVGKGTGLGLATVYGIVKQSGGDIIVTSEPGNGSCFEVFFPRVDESLAKAIESSTPAERGNETLLVAEDETALRTCMCHFLQQRGYKVLNAASGEDAEHLAGSFAGKIDLLITDVVMPKMTGRQLSEKLSVVRPGLKTLLMSGYTDEAIEPEMLTDHIRFVQKPFSLNELAHVVRDMLHSD